jgi:integrase
MAKGRQRGSIEDHGGYWRLRFYMDGKPKRKATGLAATTANKKRAEAMLDDILYEVRKGKYEPARKTAAGIGGERTFAEYTDTWLASLQLKASSVLRYRRIVKNRWKPHLGAYVLRRITRADLDEAMTRALAGKSQNYASAAVVVLKAIFKHALESDAISANPAEKIKAPLPARPKLKHADVWAAAEVPAVLAAAYAFGKHEGRMVELALLTGMRFGEVRALRWDAIDIKNAQLHVRLTAAEDYAGGDQAGPPKTEKSERTLDLGPRVVALLRLHMKEAMGKSQWLFWNPDDPEKLMPYHRLRRVMDAIGKAMGRRLSPHKTRHTFASTALSSGTLNLYEAAEIMGDSHSTVEAFYLTWADEARRREKAKALASMYPVAADSCPQHAHEDATGT